MRISSWIGNTPANGTELYQDILGYMRSTGDTIISESLDEDAALIWSVLWSGRMARSKHVWQTYRAKNKPVIVAEVGGLIRNETWRLSANGITRQSIFPHIQRLDKDRPRKLGLSLKPWHDGDYILICGQHEKSQQWEGLPSMDEYYKRTVTEIRKHSDRPIIIRSHPRYRERLFFNIDEEFYRSNGIEWNIPKKIQQTYDSFDLEVLLPHCHCVISHSSNSGLAAIMSGTHAIVSQASLAYPMATDDFSLIEKLPRPDRDMWLIELSHKEWLKHELSQAWVGLRDALHA